MSHPPAPEEVEKFLDHIVSGIRKVDPDFEGAITVEESVRDQLTLISRVTIAESGQFVDRNGRDASED